jgi:hypothetical protein
MTRACSSSASAPLDAAKARNHGRPSTVRARALTDFDQEPPFGVDVADWEIGYRVLQIWAIVRREVARCE